MTAVLALLCLAVVAASLLGGLLPLVTILTHTRLQVYLSFAAGAMLGAAFFHMMPEAITKGSRFTGRQAGCSRCSSLNGSSRSTTTRPRPTLPSLARPTRMSTRTRTAEGMRRAWSTPRLRAVLGSRPRGRRFTGGPRRSAWRYTRLGGGWPWRVRSSSMAAGARAQAGRRSDDR
jgi:hypothetical protein